MTAYTLAEDLTSTTVGREVVREGFSLELAQQLVSDIAAALLCLKNLNPRSEEQGFHH